MPTKYHKWYSLLLIFFLMIMASCSSENSEQLDTSPSPTTTPTETPKPPGTIGPFVVEQTKVLAGETIDGEVCSIIESFEVKVTTPAATFVMKFVPQTAEQGTLTWNYSIPSGPETHDATGTYTISQPGPDGRLLLSMRGTDSVAGNGFAFDQTIDYEFKLAPSSDVAC